MITVFNRRLILQTYEISEVETLTQKLKCDGVEYKVTTRIPNLRSPFGELKAISPQQMSAAVRTIYRVYVAK